MIESRSAGVLGTTEVHISLLVLVFMCHTLYSAV